MKKNKKLVIVLIGILLTVIAVIVFVVIQNKKDTSNSEEQEGESSAFGVWWWNDELEYEKYLNFAKQNEISEIYYCDSSFDENTKEFLRLAKAKNIDVYLLAGEKEWLLDKINLDLLISRYKIFQEQNKDIKFKGIHLDIEPHQFSDFDEHRNEYILKLVELANYLKTNYTQILFDYDIPFWFDDKIVFGLENKEAFKYMIDFANRVFVMSYRDTAEKIYNVGKDEIEYAESVGKDLFLCVETHSSEGDQVSFEEEGKLVMNQEIQKLRNIIGLNHGIAVHHIKTWQELKEF